MRDFVSRFLFLGCCCCVLCVVVVVVVVASSCGHDLCVRGHVRAVCVSVRLLFIYFSVWACARVLSVCFFACVHTVIDLSRTTSGHTR